MAGRDPSTLQNIRPLSATVTYVILIQIHNKVNQPQWWIHRVAKTNDQEGSPKRLHGKIREAADMLTCTY